MKSDLCRDVLIRKIQVPLLVQQQDSKALYCAVQYSTVLTHFSDVYCVHAMTISSHVFR